MVHFLELDKIFLIWRKQQHSWVIFMSQFVKETFSFGQLIISGSLEQELSFPQLACPLTKIFKNHPLHDGLIIQQLPN